MIVRHKRSWWKVEQSKVPQSYSISPGVFAGVGAGDCEYERIETPKIGDWIEKEVQSNRYKEKGQGKVITGRWHDDELGECFPGVVNR